MNQGKAILGSEPAQEFAGPGLPRSGLEPDVLPMALLLTADLIGFTQRILQICDPLLHCGFLHGLALIKTGDQLSMHDQVGITANG